MCVFADLTCVGNVFGYSVRFGKTEGHQPLIGPPATAQGKLKALGPQIPVAPVYLFEGPSAPDQVNTMGK